MIHSAKLRSLVAELNDRGGTYHKIDFGDALVVNGEYDMTRYIHQYDLPAKLDGQSVLDIGTSSGFFAFECARRGGNVTAIDLWDGSLIEEFQKSLGLSVRYEKKSIYDLDEEFGTFDLVICGSLLLHLPDIFGAVRKIRAICKGRAIIATAFLDDPERRDRGYCEFYGIQATGDGHEYGTYWAVSPTALRKMLLAAGFPKSAKSADFRSTLNRRAMDFPYLMS
jgi:2-polyprenyl-3-methyl-5-hydroxy-6-metoxy-1,4-benzoquinol methylase